MKDGHGVLLHAVVRAHVLFRDEKREHRRAVKRRDRQQVEKEQVEIDEGEHGQEHKVEVCERPVLRDKRGAWP